jgi:hypothetical protein
LNVSPAGEMKCIRKYPVSAYPGVFLMPKSVPSAVSSDARKKHV